MSLHTLANHLQSAGRGEDKVLVHMTPGEVKGLQSLAMAHGGSLTINPETGLPEAGFLKSLLPMIAGLGLSFIPGVGPMLAAGIVGGGTAIATGDLKKGIMAGLGAYGGAGLGAGLAAQGAGAATGTMSGLNAANAGQVGLQASPQMFGANVAGMADDAALASYRTFGANASGAGSGVGLNTGFTNQGLRLNAMGAPTAASGLTSSVTNASAYSPTNTGVPSYVKPPTLQTGNPPRVIEITDPGYREYVAPGFDPGKINPKETIGSFRWENGRIVDPRNIHGVPYDPTAPSAAVSGYSPSTATTSQPFKGGMSPQYAGPSGAMQTPPSAFSDRVSQMGRGFEASTKDFEGLKGLYTAMPQGSVIASGITLADAMKPEPLELQKEKSLVRPYDFDYGSTGAAGDQYSGSGERVYFNPTFTARTPYEAPGPEYAAAGGLMGYAVGGSVEQMSTMNSVGANTGYPMASIDTPMYSNPMMQRPEATNVLAPSADAGVGTYTGEARFARGGTAEPQNSGYSYSYDPKSMQFTQTGGPSTAKPPSPEIAAFDMAKRFNEMQATGKPYNFTPSWAQQASPPNGPVSGGVATPMMQPAAPAQSFVPNINIPAYQTPEQQLGLGGFYDYMNQQMRGYGGYAAGGNVSTLGGYSDGGRLLKGPGDGVSDSIPASIGNRQPARLADGEFVVPARIVSEIGNGSTEAGARKLYAMMDRVQKARRKTVGKNQVARNTKAENLLPA
jgi:hypothetical protein